MVPLIVKNDLKTEINIFWYYINNTKDLYHKKLIFNYFIDLKNLLEQVNDEKEAKNIIKNYIVSFRQKYSCKIQKIEKLIEEQVIAIGNTIVNELASLMNYKFNDNHEGYIIVPVIIPFSPFKGNTFFYSVINQLKLEDLKKLDLLIVLAHEISHFLLFEKLKEPFFADESIMTENELYFLKEILAVVLIRSNDLAQWLKTDKYEGNTLLRFLNIEDNGHIESISNYFNTFYRDYSKKELNFDVFLIDMIKKIKSISIVLDEKRRIWNQYGAERKKYANQMLEYQQPIKIE